MTMISIKYNFKPNFTSIPNTALLLLVLSLSGIKFYCLYYGYFQIKDILFKYNWLQYLPDVRRGKLTWDEIIYQAIVWDTDELIEKVSPYVAKRRKLTKLTEERRKSQMARREKQEAKLYAKSKKQIVYWMAKHSLLVLELKKALTEDLNELEANARLISGQLAEIQKYRCELEEHLHSDFLQNPPEFEDFTRTIHNMLGGITQPHEFNRQSLRLLADEKFWEDFYNEPKMKEIQRLINNYNLQIDKARKQLQELKGKISLFQEQVSHILALAQKDSNFSKSLGPNLTLLKEYQVILDQGDLRAGQVKDLEHNLSKIKEEYAIP